MDNEYRLEGPVESMGYDVGWWGEHPEYWVDMCNGPRILMPAEMWILVREHFESGPGPWIEAFVSLYESKQLSYMAHMVVIVKENKFPFPVELT